MTEQKPEPESQITNSRAALGPPSFPPLEYLLTCSKQSLQDLELGALNRSNNCMRIAKAEWQEAVAQREIAGVARWLMEHRDELLEQASRTLQVGAVPEFPESVEVTGPKRGLDKLLGPKAKSDAPAT